MFLIQFPGLFEALILLALGLGYIVIYLAHREESKLQLLGYLIGSTIIVLAIIYMVGKIVLYRHQCNYSPQLLMQHRLK